MSSVYLPSQLQNAFHGYANAKRPGYTIVPFRRYYHEDKSLGGVISSVRTVINEIYCPGCRRSFSFVSGQYDAIVYYNLDVARL